MTRLEVLDLTALLPLVPPTPEERRAERASLEADCAFFRAHPDALSYVRPYHRGEVAALLLAPYLGREPVAVAVALVSPTRRARVFIWPGMLHASARRYAEEGARRDRVRLGLQGEA